MIAKHCKTIIKRSNTIKTHDKNIGSINCKNLWIIWNEISWVIETPPTLGV